MMSDARSRTSCEPCRKRKIKCDAAIPCSSCILRKIEGSCHVQSSRSDSSPKQDHGSTSTHVHSPDRPPKRRRQSPPPPTHSSADLHAMKHSVRQIQAHIESLESKLEADVLETDDPVERENWRRVLAVIPDKAVVEVLLEYLLQECDWLRRCSDIVSLWQRAIARGGVSSSVAGILCMSLSIPSLFLGPYQTPLYRLPVDTGRIHCGLFAAAQSFISDAMNLDELELLEMLLIYSVYFGRNDIITIYLGRAMEIAAAQGWLDENSEVWRDLDRADRARARLVLGEIVASHKWSLLMAPSHQKSLRVNLCRPTPPTNLLESPIRLSLPGCADLPLRIFRIRSTEELDMGQIYRDLVLDFSDVLPPVKRLLETLMINTPTSIEDALAQSAKLQQELQEWRLVKLPNAHLRLPHVHDIDLDSPLSCHRAARALLLHSATTCVEGIITRHWLTAGRIGPPLHRFLHDECLLNAQRSCDSIPVVRAMLQTRHAPFCSSFVICGLFNAATCFAIPLLRAVQARQKPGGRLQTERHIQNLPSWPEPLLALAHTPALRTSAEIEPHTYNDADIKVYANNILVVLDMLSVLNALPCGQLAQDRLESLVQQFDLRAAPRSQNPMSAWPGADVNCSEASIADLAGALSAGGPASMDPFPEMWDELLKLDPSIWGELLKGVEGVVA